MPSLTDSRDTAKPEAPAGNRADGHWSEAKEKGSSLGLSIMVGVYRILGRLGFAVFLVPVIAWYFAVGAKARAASRAFHEKVYAVPEGRDALGRPPGFKASFLHFMNFGSAILDKVGAWMSDIPLSRLDYDNRELFSSTLAAGKGGVLLASHLGNIEVCRALGSMHRGLKLNVIVHTKHADAFNRLLAKKNAQSTVALIEATEIGMETAMLLRDRVEQGELVIIVGDRTPVGDARRTIGASFFGREAQFPEGPFILASLMDAPVLLLFCLKRGERFRIVFEPFADRLKFPRKDRREELARVISRYAARLEHHATRNPYQWFNFFDFWAPPTVARPAKELSR